VRHLTPVEAAAGPNPLRPHLPRDPGGGMFHRRYGKACRSSPKPVQNLHAEMLLRTLGAR